MAVELKPIVETTVLTTSAALLYTVGVGEKVTITKATITNYAAAAATCNFWLLPPGVGATADQYLILDTKSVQPGETFDASPLRAQSLQAGGTIWGQASAATTLAARLNAQVVS